MKAKIVLKSFPGHKGIPGHQGGSLPENAGNSAPMRSAGNSNKVSTVDESLSSSDVDAALAGTGFSSKTKSLMAYASKGMDHPKIAARYKRLQEANIPKNDLLPFTLYMVNAELNGSQLAGYEYTREYNLGFPKTVYDDNVNIKAAYDKTATKTLDRWRAAIDKLG